LIRAKRSRAGKSWSRREPDVIRTELRGAKLERAGAVKSQTLWELRRAELERAGVIKSQT
jgi:hypothetical protein